MTYKKEVYQNYEQIRLEPEELYFRQEIAPIVMHDFQMRQAQSTLTRGAVMEFKAWIYKDQINNKITYEMPDGWWELFKQKFVVDFVYGLLSFTPLMKIGFVKGWFEKWKKVKTTKVEIPAKIYFPYMNVQPKTMGYLTVPKFDYDSFSPFHSLPDGAKLAEKKADTYDKIPLWVKPDFALQIAEIAERRRIPVEYILNEILESSMYYLREVDGRYGQR